MHARTLCYVGHYVHFCSQLVVAAVAKFLLTCETTREMPPF